MQSIQLADFDRDALRTRLRKMSDEELREFGKAARYMSLSWATWATKGQNDCCFSSSRPGEKFVFVDLPSCAT